MGIIPKKEPTAEELAARGIRDLKIRARNEDGTLKGDNPDTPETNEAWKTVKKVVAKTTRKRG